MNRLTNSLVGFVFGLLSTAGVCAGATTDRERAGLIGPVQTVVTTVPTPNAGRAASQQSVTTYDPRGNEIEVVYSNFGGLSAKHVHTYDAQGKRSETALYNSDGSLSAKTGYDAQEKRTETEEYYPDGSLSAKTTYTYDSQGQLSEQSSCSVSGSCFGKKVYRYDHQGNLIGEVTYYPDSSAVRTRLVHTYDAQGQSTKTTVYEAHDPGFAIETYDARGNVTELVAYTAEGVPTNNKTVFTYEFDARGNWIKQICLGCSPSAEPGKYDCSETKETNRSISYYAGEQPRRKDKNEASPTKSELWQRIER